MLQDKPTNASKTGCWVFVHVPVASANARSWRNEERMFSRAPQVGEYVCLGSQEHWHKVTAVVHCAFAGEEAKSPHYDAEIYTEAEKVASWEIQPPLQSR